MSLAGTWLQCSSRPSTGLWEDKACQGLLAWNLQYWHVCSMYKIEPQSDPAQGSLHHGLWHCGAHLAQSWLKCLQTHKVLVLRRADVPSCTGCVEAEWKAVNLQMLQSRVGKGICSYLISHAVTLIYGTSAGGEALDRWASYWLQHSALSTQLDDVQTGIESLSKKE